MWFKTIALITVALVVCFVLAAIYGSFRWRSGTEKLRARLNAGRQPLTPTAYDAREALFGLLTVADLRGTLEAAHGDCLRVCALSADVGMRVD